MGRDVTPSSQAAAKVVRAGAGPPVDAAGPAYSCGTVTFALARALTVS